MSLESNSPKTLEPQQKDKNKRTRSINAINADAIDIGVANSQKISKNQKYFKKRSSTQRQSPRKLRKPLSGQLDSMERQKMMDVDQKEAPLASKALLKLVIGKKEKPMETRPDEHLNSVQIRKEPFMLRLRMGKTSEETLDSSIETIAKIDAPISLKSHEVNLVAKKKSRKSKILNNGGEIKDKEKQASPKPSKSNKTGLNSEAETDDKAKDIPKNSLCTETDDMDKAGKSPRRPKKGYKSSNNGIVNDDHCYACGHEGYFICCEACPKSFHLSCCFPPLKKVPKNSWHCTECQIRSNQIPNDSPLKTAIEDKERQIDGYKGIWDALCARAILSSPTCFNLKRALRVRTDIALDDLPKPSQKTTSIKKTSDKHLRSSLQAISKTPSLKVPEAAPTRVVERGTCHQCGKRSVIPSNLPLRSTPLAPRPLIKCDECPLLWHLDCVDPPLSAVPSLDSRWVCPAHIDVPIHPNWIPNVELDSNDPQQYSMKYIFGKGVIKQTLSESSIKLDFAATASKLRLHQWSVRIPEQVRQAYSNRVGEISSVQTEDYDAH